MLVRWVADLVGYPAAAAGNIASGGSIATLAAIATARDAHGLKRGRLRVGGRLPHRPGPPLHREGAPDRRAGRGAGAPRADGRRLSACARTRWPRRSPPTARPGCALAGHRRRGHHRHRRGRSARRDRRRSPQRERCWFHVDAAYGGFFLLTEHGRRAAAGDRALRLGGARPAQGPLPALRHRASCWCATRGRWPRPTTTPAHYMQDAAREPGEISPADLSPELSKHFRALRMWLPLMLLGTRPFRAALEEKLLLARYFHAGGRGGRVRGGPAARAVDRHLPLGARRARRRRRPTGSTRRSWRRCGGTAGSSSRRRCWTAASRCGWPRSPSGPTGGRSISRSGCSREQVAALEARGRGRA